MTDNLLQHLDLIAAAPDGVKRLRELILELAVRGKLVPQDPNDEPASELLKRIHAEKARLVAEGKIKKDKPLPPMSEEEKPFELPTGWEWARLGAIQTFTNGYAFKSTDFQNEGIGVIRIGDVLKDGSISLDSMVRFPSGRLAEIDPRFLVEDGDLVITMTGDVKLAINKTNERLLLNQRVGKITPHLVTAHYINLFLITKAQEKIEQASGSVISNVSTEEIKNTLISLPPLPEQYRIVAKVDELMALCDQLEARETEGDKAHSTLVKTLLETLTTASQASGGAGAARPDRFPKPVRSDSGVPSTPDRMDGDFTGHWERIARHFDTLFTTEASIDALKQTILQLAVMGKLVPQNPDEEPASELLKRIQAEKARLVAEGKIRKDKPLPAIGEEEKPFELPVGWNWWALGNIGYTQTGTTPNKSEPESFGTDYPFIKPGDIYPDFVDYKNEGLSQYGLLKSGRLAPNGSVLMVCIGTLGKCNLIDCDCSFNQQINSITPLVVVPRYLLIALRSPYFQNEVWRRSSSTTICILNKGRWEAIPTPLPPVPEQHRIVAKVDELMALCDQLADRLKAARERSGQYAMAATRSALEAA
jgi:type I restriction enzyme S subunit